MTARLLDKSMGLGHKRRARTSLVTTPCPELTVCCGDRELMSPHATIPCAVQASLDGAASGHETIYGPAAGLVYFVGIGSPYVTHVKIGFTAGDPDKRLANLQTGCPFKMRLLGFVRGCTDMERELHSVLEVDRCEGEWFVYSDYAAEIISHALGGVAG